MYNTFFGLETDPFSLTPDPRFLYLSWPHRRALAGLTYALMSRKRMILLTGEIGMGKTTLAAAAAQCLPADRIQFSVIRDSTFTAEELLEGVLLGFGLEHLPEGRPRRLAVLERFLEEGKTRGKISALVIDEAQQLPLETLEQVRLLGNLEALQIVLVGQTEVHGLINRKEAQALKQRIAVRLTVERLSAEETWQYIAHRWTMAGGSLPAPFDAEAADTVVRYSAGTPRLINVICDNALMLAYGDQVPRVTQEHVRGAAAILDLPEPGSTGVEEQGAVRQTVGAAG